MGGSRELLGQFSGSLKQEQQFLAENVLIFQRHIKFVYNVKLPSGYNLVAVSSTQNNACFA
jgi:hypothetical protein